MGKLLMEQFELYMDSMEIESRTWRDIYKDSLFSRICKIVAHELEELGLKDNAKSVKEQDEKLRKQYLTEVVYVLCNYTKSKNT